MVFLHRIRLLKLEGIGYLFEVLIIRIVTLVAHYFFEHLSDVILFLFIYNIDSFYLFTWLFVRQNKSKAKPKVKIESRRPQRSVPHELQQNTHQKQMCRLEVNPKG